MTGSVKQEAPAFRPERKSPTCPIHPDDGDI